MVKGATMIYFTDEFTALLYALRKRRPGPLCHSVETLPPAFYKEDCILIHTKNIDQHLLLTLQQHPELFVVLLSSDQVFPGTWGDFKETDVPFPCTKHGMLAYANELRIRAVLDRYLIIRSHDVNEAGPFLDVKFSYDPPDIRAEKIHFLIDNNAEGIYHIGGEKCSLYSVTKHEYGIDEVKPELTSSVGQYPEDWSLNTSRYETMRKDKE